MGSTYLSTFYQRQRTDRLLASLGSLRWQTLVEANVQTIPIFDKGWLGPDNGIDSLHCPQSFIFQISISPSITLGNNGPTNYCRKCLCGITSYSTLTKSLQSRKDIGIALQGLFPNESYQYLHSHAGSLTEESSGTLRDFVEMVFSSGRHPSR